MSELAVFIGCEARVPSEEACHIRHRIKMEKHGHQTVYFEMPLNLFNDGEFRLITSLRTPTPGDDAMTDAVAVALDENACTFVIRDARNRNYALLSDRAMTIAQIDESER